MKKKLLIIVSFLAVLLVGCDNTKTIEVDTENWTSDEGLSIEKVFDQQIDEAQYINDLDNYLSYKVASITENKPYTSELSISADLDDKSSFQGGIEFSQKKYSKTNNYETSNIEFEVNTTKSQEEPFEASGEIDLLYQDGDLYANMHSFELYMGEGNANAKMFSLMGDLLKDKWIDLEVSDGGVISLDTTSDAKLPYIVGTLKNVLKSEWVNEDSPNFLNGIAELIDTANSHIDLGISTNGLKLLTKEIEYFELPDEVIQKVFTGSFQGDESEFSLSFIASKNGLQVHLYGIKNFDNIVDSEYFFSIEENKKSEYSTEFYGIKSQQKVTNFEGKIKYSDTMEFSSDFTLNEVELIPGQKVSGKLKGNISQYNGVDDNKFPVLSEEILFLSELLSSIGINLY